MKTLYGQKVFAFNCGKFSIFNVWVNLLRKYAVIMENLLVKKTLSVF